MQIKVDGAGRHGLGQLGLNFRLPVRIPSPTIVLSSNIPPPTSGLLLFNLYVSLSRSSGCDTIRLLRDFNDEMFLQAHEPELIDEDERLDQMDIITMKWWDRMQAK